MYDSLNAHVFHEVDNNLVVKVAKMQLHKGVFDLIFETQLKQTLNEEHGVLEEIYELANDGHHLMNYVSIERLQRSGGQQQPLSEFLRIQKERGSHGKYLFTLLQAIRLVEQLNK